MGSEETIGLIPLRASQRALRCRNPPSILDLADEVIE